MKHFIRFWAIIITVFFVSLGMGLAKEAPLPEGFWSWDWTRFWAIGCLWTAIGVYHIGFNVADRFERDETKETD